VAEWASAARTLDGIAGCYFENLTDTSLPLPERVEAMRVSPGFLTLFGTSPLAGRTFSPEEERLVAPVAVISEGFWTRRFGREPAVGRQLALGENAATRLSASCPRPSRRRVSPPRCGRQCRRSRSRAPHGS
jgi:hypothetical protein